MSEVRGATQIHYVRQGDSLTCALRSTFPLKQFISNGTGAVSPSFKKNRPQIYPVVKSSLMAERVQPEAVGGHWYYNSVEIAFDDHGLSLEMGAIPAGTFETKVETIDGFTVPTLIIGKELASESNIDSDIIEWEGVVNTGFMAKVSASIEVNIEKTDGEAFVGYISINNGGVIDESVPTLTATAHLLVGGNEPKQGVTYAWSKIVVQEGADGWVPLNKTTQSITLVDTDIASSDLYQCLISYRGKSTEVVVEVADETDILIIYPNPTDGSGHTTSEELSSTKPQIVYEPKVCRRGSIDALPGYRFNYLLTEASGNTIHSQDGGASFTVTLDHAVKANGDLTLIISAEK